jgi:hypothetical protein
MKSGQLLCNSTGVFFVTRFFIGYKSTALRKVDFAGCGKNQFVREREFAGAEA